MNEPSLSRELPLARSSTRSWLASGRWLIPCVMTVLLASLAVAPWLSEEADMRGYSLPWMHATGGIRPWLAYRVGGGKYPPFTIYVLTVAGAIQRLAHLSPWGKAAVTLVKIPNILACVGGATLCAIGLRPVAGINTSRAVGVVYAFCLPVWFNAAVWGQCDAMLSLAMLAVVIAVLNDRPMTAGACIGWALSIKAQAIVILPMAAVYGLRQFGFFNSLRAAAVALGVLVLFVLPMFMAGYGHQVRQAYLTSVGFFPFLSIDAFNPWSLVSLFNQYVRHIPFETARLDSTHWLGPITPRRVGLMAFAAFTTFLMIGLYRRPTRYNAALSAGLTIYGFYMLSTEMHERYVIPAAAILTLCALSGGGRIYLAVMIPATVNQIKALVSQQCDFHSATTPGLQHVFDSVKAVGSAVNCCLFVWICWCWYRQVLAGSSLRTDRFVPPVAGIDRVPETQIFPGRRPA